MSRFEHLAKKSWMPFWMLGDPDLNRSFEIIQILVDNGADALELGIPFSDPIADGPVVQRAAMRALAAGANLEACFQLLTKIRQQYPSIPISVLSYANLAICKTADWFYAQCAQAGVDAVLLADVPTLEAAYFCQMAHKHKIDPVLIAAPNLSQTQIDSVAKYSKGYVYGLTRAGVTGADETLNLSAQKLIKKLRKAGSPPVFLGFGISKPEHVRQALLQGAHGVICGSAVISTPTEDLPSFIRAMSTSTS